MYTVLAARSTDQLERSKQFHSCTNRMHRRLHYQPSGFGWHLADFLLASKSSWSASRATWISSGGALCIFGYFVTSVWPALMIFGYIVPGIMSLFSVACRCVLGLVTISFELFSHLRALSGKSSTPAKSQDYEYRSICTSNIKTNTFSMCRMWLQRKKEFIKSKINWFLGPG